MSLESLEDKQLMVEPLEEVGSYAESIVETLRQPLLILDKELRVRTANRSFYQTFQVSPEETEGIHLFNIGNSQWDIAELRSLLAETFTQNTRDKDYEVNLEFPIIGRKVMLLSARPLYGEGARTPLILLAIEDITERKRAEQELRNSEERLQFLTHATNDAVYDKNLETNEVWWSASFFAMFGYCKAEIEPTIESWTNKIHPDDVEKVLLEGGEVIKTGGRAWSGEYRFRRRDGSYAIVHDRGYILHTEEGKAVRFLGSLMDITERKQIEEKLKIFTAKLERSNRELQDFASVASHDLQEPLRKIQAFGDRLKTKYHDSIGVDGRDYVERMQSAAGRMQTLINDLLTFSRVETKAQPFVTVDLTIVAQEVLSDMEIQIERASAVIEVEELAIIEADPLQIRQLMQNLIGNSLKYRQKGKTAVIKIRGHFIKNRHYPTGAEPSQDSELYQIEVEDNGIGFDEKYLDRIFTVFQRLHGRQEFKGTGVGLAVCRKLVERHGGQITARSKPGYGATFMVTLPVKQLSGGMK